MADGLYYHDTRAPFQIADQTSAVTLATTDKALIVSGTMPAFGSGYMNVLGKKVMLRVFGKITTAATPGNGSFTLYWGTNADANGTSLGVSTVNTLVASQTNLSWCAEFVITTRATGASGSLFARGWAMMNEAVSVAHYVLPASAAAGVTVDLTGSSVISLQFKRSGSTAETMTVQDFEFIALN